MNSCVRRVLTFAGLLACALGGTDAARAALGGDADSVRADAIAMHGEIRTTPLQAYDVDEVRTDGGLRIREFVNRRGLVFAVAWEGPVVPDLRRLLGASFPNYAVDPASRPAGLKRAIVVSTRDIVVESSGHLRAFRGHAYLPALVPSGLSPTELR
jgi:hypothetical protein